MDLGGRTACPRVLIAEDDREIRLLLELQLDRAGFETVSAPGGKEALQIALSGAVDLVVLDAALPEIDGLSILERMRASDGASRLPVVMVSANVQESDVQKAMGRGANAYVTKPFRSDELLAAISDALRS